MTRAPVGAKGNQNHGERHFVPLDVVRSLPVSLSVDVGPLGMLWRDVAPEPAPAVRARWGARRLTARQAAFLS